MSSQVVISKVLYNVSVSEETIKDRFFRALSCACCCKKASIVLSNDNIYHFVNQMTRYSNKATDTTSYKNYLLWRHPMKIKFTNNVIKHSFEVLVIPNFNKSVGIVIRGKLITFV